jgi:tripartite-type tricarboxylate transporter receptor subunit TctC
MTRSCPSTGLRLLRGALLSLVAVCAAAHSDLSRAAWPDRPIKLIVPFPPGGNADVLGRIVAAKLSMSLNANVIVENKPGAGSMLGSNYVANARPDGYTILLGSIANVLNNYVYRKPLFDIRHDLTPVSQVASVPNYIAVNPKLNINTLDQLIDYAKKNQGKTTCAVSGVGTSPYLSCELFKQAAGLQMTTVPYGGAVAAIQDTIGGRDTIATVNESLPYITSHQLVGVAVTSSQRSPYAPDLPAVSERFPGYEVTSWYGVFAPAATPPEIVAKLGAEIEKSMQDADVKKKLAPIGAIPVQSSPTQFKTFVDGELNKWEGVVKALDLHLD